MNNKWTISKVSERGTSHPVVASLVVQISELIRWSNLSEEERNKVLETCFNSLQKRLGRCWDICSKISQAQKTELSKYTQSDECTNHFPHIIDLDRETDNFLYETKNFLRDLLNDVVKVFFPDINFDDARSFFNGKNHKGDGKLTAWASSKFGKDHKITLMLRADQPWIEELVRKRNAVEHPGGHSGELKIQNFALTKDGKLIKPVWARTGCQ